MHASSDISPFRRWVEPLLVLAALGGGAWYFMNRDKPDGDAVALARTHLPAAQALAAKVAGLCPPRTPDADFPDLTNQPSPAEGNPLVVASGVVGVRVACWFDWRTWPGKEHLVEVGDHYPDLGREAPPDQAPSKVQVIEGKWIDAPKTPPTELDSARVAVWDELPGRVGLIVTRRVPMAQSAFGEVVVLIARPR